MARYDVEIYNEATGWVITSQGLAGRDLTEVDDDDTLWRSLIGDGVFVPLELAQDDPLQVRVVVDEPLTEQEEAEWVGHAPARLRVPAGVLTLTGGTEYLTGEAMEDFTQHIEVPPGDYRLDVYTYLPWLNGEYCLSAASTEPIGAYFRRTRPGEPFPGWLRDMCFEEPELDPGHEDEWDEDEEGDDAEYDDTSMVMFLVHLRSVTGWEGVPSAPLNGDGWVAHDTGARQPARCPLGLPFTG